MPVAKTQASHAVIQTFPIVSKTLASHSVFARQISKTIASHGVFKSIVSKTLASHAVFARKTSKTGSLSNTFYETARGIYALNTETQVESFLGTLLDGQTTLVDVSLADGFYNIEVRSSANFYKETRSRILFPVEIVAGVIASQGVPSIDDLTSEITNAFSRKLRWSIPDVAYQDGLKFGIWRSASSPVVVTGPPDFEVQAFEGWGKYSKFFTQTVDEFYAVAAIVGSDQGPESEIFAEWDLTPPNPPANQFGYKKVE